MTLFGKILLTLILVTGTVLIIKGGSKEESLSSETPSSETENIDATEESVDENSFKGSLKDLITRGGNYKCDFTHSTDVADSSGTVFITGNKIRGNFTSLAKPANMTVESYMISDGEFSYVWSNMMPMGMKVKVDMSQADTSTGTAGSFDYNQSLDYSCAPWSVDESVFKIPEDIKFTELPAAS